MITIWGVCSHISQEDKLIINGIFGISLYWQDMELKWNSHYILSKIFTVNNLSKFHVRSRYLDTGAFPQNLNGPLPLQS